MVGYTIASKVPVFLTTLPCCLKRINNLYLSYDTLQLVSHNILMDTKDAWNRPGTTCAPVDALGSHGRSKFTVCVDCSIFPYGRCMTRGLVSG